MVKNSIRKKFRLAFAGLALGPLIILGFLVIRESYHSQLAQTEMQQMEICRSAVLRVERFFLSVEEHLHVFLSISNLKNMSSLQLNEALSLLLFHKDDKHGDLFTQILIKSPEGGILGCASPLGHCRGLETLVGTVSGEMLSRLSSGQTWVGPVRFDNDAGEPRMLIALPVRDVRSGRLWAILLVDIRLKEIWNVINRVKRDIKGEVYILDVNNRIIAHPDPSVVLKGTRFEVPSKAGITTGFSGNEVVMAVQAVDFENLSFRVVTERSLKEVLESTLNLLWKLGAILLLALAGVVIMGAWTQRQIVRPIEYLVKKAGEIGGGDLDQRLELKRRDEFGELAESFNAMARSLKKTIASLEAENIERMQKETALRQEKRFSDSLIASLPGVFYHFDQQGKFLSWNRNLEKVSGLTADELSKTNPVELFDVEDGKRVAKSIEEVFRKGEASVEAVFLSKEGQGSTFHLTGRRFDVGERRDVVGVGVDITLQKEAQESLEETLRNLEHANMELEHFTFATSHHLQEPLRKVQTFGDRLKKGYPNEVGQKGKDYIDRMQRSTNRMQEMLDGLLLFSRIRSGLLSWVPVDMGRLTRDVASELEDRYKGSGGRVEIGDLPLLEGDPLRIRTLFRHLMDNGFKFGRDGVSPVVRVFGQEIDGHCRISVEDNGIGFDEKYMDRIFEPFQRLHPMDRYGGVGIGLAICRRIAEAHGGRMTATSRPGAGSIFVVDLPLKRRVETSNEQPVTSNQQRVTIGAEK